MAEIDENVVAVLGVRKRNALIEALRGVMDL